MSTMTAERRTYEGVQVRELETDDAYRTLTGLAVPYDREADIGWFVEEFAPGSLAKSIKESARALPLLMHHGRDSADPVGSAESWEETAAGLRGTWRLDTSARAQEAARMVAEGHLNFMSIRFAPIRSEWTYVEDWNPDLGASHKDRVRRIEARLLEVSLVSTPAYNEAAIEWVRSAEPMRKRVDERRAVDAWRDELARLRG